MNEAREKASVHGEFRSSNASESARELALISPSLKTCACARVLSRACRMRVRAREKMRVSVYGESVRVRAREIFFAHPQHAHLERERG